MYTSLHNLNASLQLIQFTIQFVQMFFKSPIFVLIYKSSLFTLKSISLLFVPVTDLLLQQYQWSHILQLFSFWWYHSTVFSYPSCIQRMFIISRRWLDSGSNFTRQLYRRYHVLQIASYKSHNIIIMTLKLKTKLGLGTGSLITLDFPIKHFAKSLITGDLLESISILWY